MYPTLRISSGWLSNALPLGPPPAARSRTTCVMVSLYGCAAATCAEAFAMRLAAMSSCARVIFCVDWMLLIRLRRILSRPPAIVNRYSLAASARPATNEAWKSLTAADNASSPGSAPVSRISARRPE